MDCSILTLTAAFPRMSWVCACPLQMLPKLLITVIMAISVAFVAAMPANLQAEQELALIDGGESTNLTARDDQPIIATFWNNENCDGKGDDLAYNPNGGCYNMQIYGFIRAKFWHRGWMYRDGLCSRGGDKMPEQGVCWGFNDNAVITGITIW